jgi:hypothetical protein
MLRQADNDGTVTNGFNKHYTITLNKTDVFLPNLYGSWAGI